MTDVKEYLEKVSRSVDQFSVIYDNSADPINTLFSEEGQWLLKAPLTYSSKQFKKEFLESIVRDINNIIFEESDGNYRISNAIIEEEKMELTISTGGKKLLIWELYDNYVRADSFNDAHKCYQMMHKMKVELDEKEQELNSTRIILSSKDALLKNNFINAYFRSVFRPIKFKEERALILQELELELDHIINKYNNFENEYKKLKGDQDVIDVLNFMNITFKRFPYIKTFEDYKKYKEDRRRGK